jgi:GMP synthase PP-ATPase subunit
MVRSFVAYLLIFTLIGSNFSRFFIYAGFELNRNYISSKLCVNRDKPWLHCNGKCYFMKKIKQAEDREKSQQRETQKNLFQEAFTSTPIKVKFHQVLLRVMFIPYNCTLTPNTGDGIFRPPQFG